MSTYDTESGRLNYSKARRDFKEIQGKKKEREARQNSGFVQMYPPALKRLRALMSSPKTVSAAKLYTALTELIDNGGLVTVPQDVLAQMCGCSTKTISRHSKVLEDEGALVRIQIQGGVYVYALNPEEVWAAYDKDKEFSAFYTKTLVPNGKIRKKRLTFIMKGKAATDRQ
ncbi:MAG: ArsR family transcriptional regulator [Paracoccaceae bacterium]|nr:ArsR family transcriptional regulator [Paracoccaceae bacterium]